ISSLDFNGSTVGWGLFYRLVNLWAPARLSVGLEAGYEALKFTDLEAGNPSGVFVGQPGRRLENLNGAAAYLDNSGFYVRLVIGWAKDSSTEAGQAAGAKSAASGSGSGREAAEAALLAKARALRLGGDRAGALQCYRAYLVARPSDPEAWLELGKIYQDYGRTAFAQECFDRARALGTGPKP
ncbi:MAG TPA: tetratricopeptide repeat protein, partial [bacterium]|nr:tetratricopeptide repeat protein [bacterium]